MNQYQNPECSRHPKTALPAALERAVNFQAEAAQLLHSASRRKPPVNPNAIARLLRNTLS